MDEYTRFSNAVILKNKDDAAEAFLIHWIKFCGRPQKIFSDNGGEFIGQDMMAICNHFEIEPITTAAYCAFSNGKCERHNQTLTNMMNLVKHDLGCSYELALAWAVCAKNLLANVGQVGQVLVLPNLFSVRIVVYLV